MASKKAFTVWVPNANRKSGHHPFLVVWAKSQKDAKEQAGAEYMGKFDEPLPRGSYLTEARIA